MADLVKAGLAKPIKVFGVLSAGPTKVADADETNLSTPDVSIVFDTRGTSFMRVYVKFANYTSVTVKAQRSVDGTNYVDIADATTSTNNTTYSFVPQAPFVRLSVAGTLSESADTMEVWAYAEYTS